MDNLQTNVLYCLWLLGTRSVPNNLLQIDHKIIVIILASKDGWKGYELFKTCTTKLHTEIRVRSAITKGHAQVNCYG